MDLFKSWNDRATAAGTNLTQVAMDCKVDRSWLERLKKRLPKALQFYFKIEGHLGGLENQKTEGDEA